MNTPLPIKFTKNFKINFNGIPERDQKRISYDLTHMDKRDILRQGHLQGELNYLRKMNNGSYRIFLAYCAECYENFREKINCQICDASDLERIVAFFISPRKKLYSPQNIKHIDVRKIKF